MKRTKNVACLLFASVLGVGGVSHAATFACSASGAELTPPVVPAVSLPAGRTTGPAIQVDRAASGAAIITIRDGAVMLRKEISPRSSVTTMGAGAERVVLTVEGQEVVVTRAGKATRGSLSQRDTLTEVFNVLHASKAVAQAKTMLDRAVLLADSPSGNALLLTRALLGSVLGDAAGTRDYQQWIATKAAQPKIVRAAFRPGPGECWDEYAKEAIRIQKDFEACVHDCGWIGLGFCQLGCSAIFELRAEGAMMWYLSCNGKFFVG